MANKQERNKNAYLEYKRTNRYGCKRRKIDKLTNDIINGGQQRPNISSRKVPKNHFEKRNPIEIESLPCLPSEFNNEVNIIEDDIIYLSDSISDSNSVLDYEQCVERSFSIDIAYKFKCGLKNWAVTENVTQKQLRALLNVCNNSLPFSLPMEPSTLLKTPKPTITVLNDGGKYWHNGVDTGLQNTLKSVLHIPSKISLNINVDGIPIAKSSNAQFWPILGNIHELKDIQPFIIGVFYGKSIVLKFIASIEIM